VLPIVESRIPVDSVDRVVVRQARDIESTYYLLKQFLADEQLRSTILVPFGVALLLVPALFYWFSAGEAIAGVAGLLGAALLYKGLAIDRFVAGMPERIREALYAGQVSVVTYVVAGGLALVGGFFGVLSASALSDAPALVEAVEFTYAAVPWFAVAGVTAAVGRLLDELIRDEGIRTPYLNLPFVIAAVALVVRGFAGYFLAQEGDPRAVRGGWPRRESGPAARGVHRRRYRGLAYGSQARERRGYGNAGGRDRRGSGDGREVRAGRFCHPRSPRATAPLCRSRSRERAWTCTD